MVVDAARLELFCLSCRDYVYCDEFDQAVQVTLGLDQTVLVDVLRA